LLIICSLEKLTLLSNNVPLKLTLVLETCLVLLLLPPPEDSLPFKTLLKSMLLLISSKEEISSENHPEFLSLISSELLTYSITSLNSLFPSIMVLLEDKMLWELLMKESSLPLYLLNKFLICMKDLKNSLIEVLPVYYGLKDNSWDMMKMVMEN
jgi:hypothetical protein